MNASFDAARANLRLVFPREAQFVGNLLMAPCINTKFGNQTF